MSLADSPRNGTLNTVEQPDSTMRRESHPATSPEIREEGLDALETLAHETRLSILRTLADADRPLRFSELRKRIGLTDTGKFNYHLSELLGRFVRESDGGYELGPAGERTILAAGDLDAAALSIAATDDESTCPVCSESDCDKQIHIHLAGQ